MSAKTHTLEEYGSSDALWVNVQAPIRNMFVALAKTVQEQQSEISSMRQVLHGTTNTENVKDIVKMMAMSRTEAADLTQTKAALSDVKSLEIKVEDANKQVARLTQIIQHQTTAITDLNYRLEKAHEIIEGQQKHIHAPNFDPIFKYVDKNVKVLHEEIMEKVHHKVTMAGERHDSWRNERIEDVVKALHTEMNEQRVILAAKAEKDLLAPIQSQILVNKQQIEKNMAMIEINGRRHTEQCTDDAVRPVKEQMASLEASLVDQNAHLRARVAEVERRVDAEARELDEKLNHHRTTVEKLCSDTTLMESVAVETVRRNHWDGDVKESTMRAKIADSVAATLQETRVEADKLKAALEQEQDTKLTHWYKLFQNKLDTVRVSYDHLEASSADAQKKMEELTEGLIKSLQKKANQSDLRALVKGTASIVKGEGATAMSLVRGAVDTARQGGADPGTSSASPSSTSNEEYTQVAAAVLALGQGTGTKELLEGKIAEVCAAVDGMRLAHSSLELELKQVHSDLDRKPSREDVDIAVMKMVTGEIGSISSSEGGVKGKALSSTSAAAAASKGTTGYYHPSRAADMEASWRMAVGEVASELRRELATKVSKDECQVYTRQETSPLASQLNKAAAALGDKAERATVAKVEQNLAILHSRVVSELTGGLWLWTSRQLTSDSLVPWDSQVVNAAPSSLLWREGTTGILVKLPGLYRLGVSIFTALPVAVTILLNDEPLMSIQPDTGSDRPLSSYANAQGLREERYAIKRLRHSAGDVTAVTVDEPLSLPANATLSVRYQSAAASQAFLALRKL
jgi:hypothetical protein